MQVKVCPKCGSENRPTSITCAQCYASLDGVQATLSKEPAQVAAVQRPAAPPQPAAPAAAPPPLGQSAGPYSPPRPMGYLPNLEGLAPAKRQSSGFPAVAIILVILLCAGGFAGWWFFLKTPNPEAVARKLTDAMKAGDVATVKSCLSKNSLSMLPAGGDQQAAEGLKQLAEINQWKILNTTYEGDNAVVQMETKMILKLPPGLQARLKAKLGDDANKTYLVLIKEDGQWKADMAASAQRSMRAMSAR